MKDRLFFASLAALTLVMIALAAVWPQGYGDRSLGPFGHMPIQQTPEMKAAMAREAAAQDQRRRSRTVTSAAVAAGLRINP